MSGLLPRGPSLSQATARLGDRAVAAIAGAARPGTRAAIVLRRALPVPWHALAAWVLASLALADAASAQAARGCPAAWLALLAIPVGATLLRRPVALGLVIAVAGTFLRALYLGAPETCDQMAVSRAALATITGGANPYGYGYPESVPPGAPYPYGPLAAATSLLGVPGEVLAMGAILAILAASRALLTLAFLAGWVPWVELGVCGINDQVPALLLLVGLLLLERRRLSGALLVAVSAAIKPYGLAWLPPLVGYGGLTLALPMLVAAAVPWLPLLAWGPSSYLASIELARSIHPRAENTLDMPHLRVLALPVAVASLWVRSWPTMVLAGAIIFLVVLFLDRWASFGYWLVVLPPVGIVVERGLRGFGDRLRLGVGQALGSHGRDAQVA